MRSCLPRAVLKFCHFSSKNIRTMFLFWVLTNYRVCGFVYFLIDRNDPNRCARPPCPPEQRAVRGSVAAEEAADRGRVPPAGGGHDPRAHLPHGHHAGARGRCHTPAGGGGGTSVGMTAFAPGPCFLERFSGLRLPPMPRTPDETSTSLTAYTHTHAYISATKDTTPKPSTTPDTYIPPAPAWVAACPSLWDSGADRVVGAISISDPTKSMAWKRSPGGRHGVTAGASAPPPSGRAPRPGATASPRPGPRKAPHAGRWDSAWGSFTSITGDRSNGLKLKGFHFCKKEVPQREHFEKR